MADDLTQMGLNPMTQGAAAPASGFPMAPPAAAAPQVDPATQTAVYQRLLQAQRDRDALAKQQQASQANNQLTSQAPNQAVFAPSGFPQQGSQSAPSTQDAMIGAIQSGGDPGIQGPQQPQPQQQYPQMPGRPEPIAVTALRGFLKPSSVGAGSRSQVFEGFLGNFIGALGKGFANEGHGPGAAMRGAGAAIGAPYEQAVNQWQMGQQAQQQQAQIGQEQAQTAMTNAQREQLGQMIGVPDGRGGIMYLPSALAKTALPAAIGAQGKLNAAQARKPFMAVPGRGLFDMNAADGPALVPGSGPDGMKVTSDLVKQTGIPGLDQFIGKTIPLQQWSAMERGAAILNAPVQGAGGPVSMQKLTGNITQPSQPLGNPGVAAAQAGAYANAKYGLVQTVDKETGAPYYESRLDAPGTAPAAGAFDIMRGRQGLDNYKRALGTIKDNLGVLDDPVQRGLIAETLKNTSESHDKGFISTTIAHMISSGLDPRAADLVAGTLSAREFISANRQFAGNVVGSEALVGRMISNIAGPGGARMLNEDLLQRDLDNTERISKGLREFQGGKSGGVGASQLPVQARTRLKEGIHTKFGNGQIWTLQNGNPVQVTQ